MKECSKCGASKPKSEYYAQKSNKDGLYSYCKSCTCGIQRDRRKKYGTEYYRNKRFIKKYGINYSAYQQMLMEQDHKCLVCGIEYDENDRTTTFFVDHNHSTGEVRGLLCQRCNTGLGMFQDDPAILQLAMNYLQTKGYYGKI